MGLELQVSRKHFREELPERGKAHGFASLDGTSLVVENPASASLLPGNSKIPITGPSGTTIAVGYLGTGVVDASKILRGDSTWGAVPNAAVAEVLALADLSDVTGKTGSLTTVVLQNEPTIVQPVIADLSNMQHAHTAASGGGTLSAAAIASGTMATARLGSGVADSTTVLRGDSAWAQITDAQVAAANKDGADGTASMRTLGFSAGKAAPGVWLPVPIRITSNITTTSDAAGNVTGLVFSIAANEVWSFEVHMMTQCSAANGIKFALDVPTACTITASMRGTRGSVASIISDDITADDVLSAAINTGTYATGGWVDIYGVAANGANAGSVQVRFASATAGDTSTVKAQSFLVARRIA